MDNYACAMTTALPLHEKNSTPATTKTVAVVPMTTAMYAEACSSQFSFSDPLADPQTRICVRVFRCP